MFQGRAGLHARSNSKPTVPSGDVPSCSNHAALTSNLPEVPCHSAGHAWPVTSSGDRNSTTLPPRLFHLTSDASQNPAPAPCSGGDAQPRPCPSFRVYLHERQSYRRGESSTHWFTPRRLQWPGLRPPHAGAGWPIGSTSGYSRLTPRGL